MTCSTVRILKGQRAKGKGDGMPNKALRGAAAGFAATMPMTVVMEAMRAALPAEQHRRMPPREIVDRTIEKTEETAGTSAQLDRGDRLALTTVAHLAFGDRRRCPLRRLRPPAGRRHWPELPMGLASGRPRTVSGCRRSASILPHPTTRRIAMRSDRLACCVGCDSGSAVVILAFWIFRPKIVQLEVRNRQAHARIAQLETLLKQGRTLLQGLRTQLDDVKRERDGLREERDRLALEAPVDRIAPRVTRRETWRGGKDVEQLRADAEHAVALAREIISRYDGPASLINCA